MRVLSLVVQRAVGKAIIAGTLDALDQNGDERALVCAALQLLARMCEAEDSWGVGSLSVTHPRALQVVYTGMQIGSVATVRHCCCVLRAVAMHGSEGMIMKQMVEALLQLMGSAHLLDPQCASLMVSTVSSCVDAGVLLEEGVPLLLEGSVTVLLCAMRMHAANSQLQLEALGTIQQLLSWSREAPCEHSTVLAINEQQDSGWAVMQLVMDLLADLDASPLLLACCCRVAALSCVHTEGKGTDQLAPLLAAVLSLHKEHEELQLSVAGLVTAMGSRRLKQDRWDQCVGGIRGMLSSASAPVQLAGADALTQLALACQPQTVECVDGLLDLCCVDRHSDQLSAACDAVCAVVQKVLGLLPGCFAERIELIVQSHVQCKQAAMDCIGLLTLCPKLVLSVDTVSAVVQLMDENHEDDALQHSACCILHTMGCVTDKAAATVIEMGGGAAVVRAIGNRQVTSPVVIAAAEAMCTLICTTSKPAENDRWWHETGVCL